MLNMIDFKGGYVTNIYISQIQVTKHSIIKFTTNC